MPSPEARACWEFAAAWTNYRIEAPSSLETVVEPLIRSTPRFWDPTHQVDYAVGPSSGETYRLTEQDDEIGTGDRDWLSVTLASRMKTRLLQIAELAGWAPLHGALVESGGVRSLLIADRGDQRHMLPGLATAPLDWAGQGVALVQPGRAAIVGATIATAAPLEHLVSARQPDQLIALTDTGADRAIRPLATPELIEVILSAVIDADDRLASTGATAVKSLIDVRAWRVSIGDLETTIRAVTTQIG